MLLFSITTVRTALAVSQNAVKVIAETTSNLFLSPCDTKPHGQFTAWTYYQLY